jgi:hypothetical protein
MRRDHKNPKPETRNPKESGKPEIEEWAEPTFFRISDFLPSFGFRTSDFALYRSTAVDAVD